MFFNGKWGTVCDDRWGRGSSTVVCRQLGLGNTGTFNHFGAGPMTFPILLDDVIISVMEMKLISSHVHT